MGAELNVRCDLDQQMAQVIAELSVISHVPAASLQPRTTGPKPSTVTPRGDIGPIDDLRRDYGPPFHAATSQHPGARNDDDRAHIIKRARHHLTDLRGGQATRDDRPFGESPAERDKRITDGAPRDAVTGRSENYTGWTPKEVASAVHCTERDVRRARTDAGLDPLTGKTLDAPEDRPERARRLRAGGSSTRDVARVMGVSQTQVIRWTATTNEDRRAA